MFHGEEAPCKNGVSFQQWLFEARSVQGLYSEPFFRQAVIQALNGTVSNLVRYMGTRVEVEGNVSKLETVYGIVASYLCSDAIIYKIRIGMKRFQHILTG